MFNVCLLAGRSKVNLFISGGFMSPAAGEMKGLPQHSTGFILSFSSVLGNYILKEISAKCTTVFTNCVSLMFGTE